MGLENSYISAGTITWLRKTYVTNNTARLRQMISWSSPVFLLKWFAKRHTSILQISRFLVLHNYIFNVCVNWDFIWKVGRTQKIWKSINTSVVWAPVRPRNHKPQDTPPPYHSRSLVVFLPSVGSIADLFLRYIRVTGTCLGYGLLLRGRQKSVGADDRPAYTSF